jgi:hypothetical protein
MDVRSREQHVESVRQEHWPADPKQKTKPDEARKLTPQLISLCR